VANKRVKLQVGEDLSKGNIERVLEYLDTESSTKKVACDMLGIRYNTTRLTRILEEYSEDKERYARIRKKKRGTPVLKEEACSIIEEYLIQRSMSKVATMHYRSTALIRQTLIKYGADLVAGKTDYFNPELLPDLSMRDSFEKDELVWSARHNCIARVLGPVKGGYWVWVLGSNAQQSALATEELGSLELLTELGVNLEKVANQHVGAENN